MSVQPKTQEEIVSNAYPVLPPVGSKIVALNGKERTIELIKIDDPRGLDPEILKLEKLKNSNFNKMTILEVAWLVGLAVFGLLIATSVITAASPLLPIVLFTSVGLCVLSEHFSYEGRDNRRKILKMKDCQEAMKTGEFQVFAKRVGDAFTAEDLLKVYSFFMKSKAIQSKYEASQDKLERDLAALKK